MPQIFYHPVNDTTQLLVWHITEPESFFQGAAQGARIVAHPHKRLQHLCGRYLLQQLVPQFPLSQIIAEHNNKPFLPGNSYHFSISHCDDYVAALVSTTLSVGIDVETITDKVRKIRHKFLTNHEEAMLADTAINWTELEKLTLAWSTKETLFKYLGESGVDFREHLILNTIQGSLLSGLILANLNRTLQKEVRVQYHYLRNVVLTWLANSHS